MLKVTEVACGRVMSKPRTANSVNISGLYMEFTLHKSSILLCQLNKHERHECRMKKRSKDGDGTERSKCQQRRKTMKISNSSTANLWTDSPWRQVDELSTIAKSKNGKVDKIQPLSVSMKFHKLLMRKTIQTMEMKWRECSICCFNVTLGLNLTNLPQNYLLRGMSHRLTCCSHCD